MLNLNSLLDKGLEPDTNKTYILLHDVRHYKSITEFQTIPKGTIIEQVTMKIDKSGLFAGYEFTVKETGKKSHTNYPADIAEYNEENLKKIEEYYKKIEEFFRVKRELGEYQDRIQTLKPRKELKK